MTEPPVRLSGALCGLAQGTRSEAAAWQNIQQEFVNADFCDVHWYFRRPMRRTSACVYRTVRKIFSVILAHTNDHRADGHWAQQTSNDQTDLSSRGNGLT